MGPALRSWSTLTGRFEQREISSDGRLLVSDAADVEAVRRKRLLRLRYSLHFFAETNDVLTVRAGGFQWERRRGDGSEEAPRDATDSVSDHGLWGLLEPESLFEGAQVDVLQESRSEFRLRPRLTTQHRLADGMPTTTEARTPSWVSIAPALYVAEAAFYRVRLHDSRTVVESLAAVEVDTTEQVLRSWALHDVQFDAPVDISLPSAKRP